MSYSSTNTPANDQPARLFFPALAPVYAALQPLAETWLRVICGIALMVHGWPKLMDPMGAVGMVESIGFVPGGFWSPALAVTEFFGGLLLVLGLLTRFAAAGSTIILLVTIWFHWVMLDQGYGGAEISLLWSAITFWFVARGGGRYSLARVSGGQLSAPGPGRRMPPRPALPIPAHSHAPPLCEKPWRPAQ